MYEHISLHSLHQRESASFVIADELEHCQYLRSVVTTNEDKVAALLF